MLENLKLVIIDNISDLFSFEYTQSLSAEKHMKLMRLMHELALCAINYDVAIVITNNVRFDGYENKEIANGWIDINYNVYQRSNNGEDHV